MKKQLLFFMGLFLSIGLFAQNLSKEKQLELDKAFAGDQHEIYFKLTPGSKKIALQLGKTISVDHNSNEQVTYAYANKKEFANFLNMNLEYELLPHPGTLLKNIKMSDIGDIRTNYAYDTYPTYEAYEAMMLGFAEDHPDHCQVSTFKTLNSGRKLYLARITSDLSVDNTKPRFLYTAQMHGDEVVTYMLMLRLIDHLLSNYGSDTQITKLLDNIDIYINPLANPDGTYAGGNNSVYGATRSNANYIDINRNFPDPQDGVNPDGEEHQPETLAFMELGLDYGFTMSANLHSGIELVNYPWDTWSTRHADDAWWIRLSRAFADEAQANSPAGYFTGMDNGITNGYDWYEVAGGRQDYMNYFTGCREFTLEHSDVKMLAESKLNDHWNYNKQSFLNYMEQVLYGLNGKVTDATDDSVLEDVKIFVKNHDKDSSWVFTNSKGFFFRPIDPGTYDFIFSAPGYNNYELNGYEITSNTTHMENIQLTPADMSIPVIHSDIANAATGQLVTFNATAEGALGAYEWVFENGVPATSTDANPVVYWEEDGDNKVQLKLVVDGEEKEVETNINVSNELIVANATVSIIESTFVDDGGSDNNYSDGTNYGMLFKPVGNDAVIKMTFSEFEVEFDDDCSWDYMEIYDGENTSAPLIGKYCGTNSPGTIEATSESGCIYVKFFADALSNKKGWVANVKSIVPVGLTETVLTPISVYPNPANGDQVIVASDKHINSVTLVDLQGRTLMTEQVNAPKVELNIAQMPKGVILVKITKEDGSISLRKLIRK